MNKIAMLEAILFTTMEPLSLKQIKKIMGISEKELIKLIDELKIEYEDETHGLMVWDIGGYKITVKSEYKDYISSLTPHSDMSRGLLRVLSIIAFHQPIEQSEIVKVIGNRTYEYVKKLESKNFVKSDKKSRTKILTVTSDFEKYFGTRSDELKKFLKEKREQNENE